MALSTLFFNDRKCLKIKTSSVFSPVVYTAAIMKAQQNNNTDLIFNDCSVLPHFLWSADMNYFVVLTSSGDTIYPLLTFSTGSAWFASPNVIVRDPPAASRPRIRKASCGSASCIPSPSRRGLSGPPGALGPGSAAAGAQEGAGAEGGGGGGSGRGASRPPGGSAASLGWDFKGSGAGEDEMASRGERRKEGSTGQTGRQGSVLEHAVVLVNLGTVLSLDPFLITSSERRDVLVTGTRGKQNPNAGSFLLDNKHPVITT